MKEQAGVKNVTTRNSKNLAWLTNEPNRAIEINALDDLSKVGIVTPDWKRLHKYGAHLCSPKQTVSQSKVGFCVNEGSVSNS